MTADIDLDSPDIRALREKIALGCRILAKLELVDYLGHVSARVPGTDQVLIRARGAEQGNQLHMTYKQVSLVDPTAGSISGIVSGIDNSSGTAQVIVNGNSYDISTIQNVTTPPAATTNTQTN